MDFEVHIIIIFIINIINEVNGINTGGNRDCAVSIASGYGLNGRRAGV